MSGDASLPIAHVDLRNRAFDMRGGGVTDPSATGMFLP